MREQNYELSCIHIFDLWSYAKRFEEAKNRFHKELGSDFEFLINCHELHVPVLSKMAEIEELFEADKMETWITGPIDRDWFHEYKHGALKPLISDEFIGDI
jgi:hypothetical protein